MRCSSIALYALVALLLSVGAVASADETGAVSETNWGVGIGIPYGVIGANVEYGAQTRLSVGVGSAVAALGWNVGVKHYFQPPTEDKGSMSVSVYYGTNTYIDYPMGDDEVDTGFSVGLGWTSGHFDVGLMLPFAADVPEGAEEQGTAVKLYVGYRF